MKPPLAGRRIVELTHVWSGPLCGQVLADLGAEVIRVESRTHLDIHRRGGPYPDGIAGVNRSGTWNAQNRGKRSCTLDLKSAEGKELLLGLACKTDAIIENFTPGTLDRLGVGFAALRQVNPSVVLLSLSGYGDCGPYRDSLAYGPMMDAATGLSAATTYGDGVPRAVNGWAADVGGALYGCAALLRCLLDDDRAARHLDVSQFEAGVMFLAESLVAESSAQATPASQGHFSVTVPTLGDDCWVAVAARTPGELRALCELTGADDACARGDLEQKLAEWSVTRRGDAAIEALRGAGVPAAPVATLRDLLDDPQLEGRGAWMKTDHPETGLTRSYGPAIRVRGVPPPQRPAPLLGGDNDYVFGELLGLSPDEIRGLAERKVM